ncbi:MAG: hypothetical protein JWO38_1838 [Gemmataceae bacterium]|nr:hypothetical protein [Gemmataceae bacterium]
MVLERFESSGLANGGEWDIPTERIPPSLRRIGSRFVIIGQLIRGEERDTPDQLRAALRTLWIERIEAENET